ncbi:MAG: iron-sulfur cluster assembly scaffold protein [Candidatus Aenigmatarchaeota archaeon]
MALDIYSQRIIDYYKNPKNKGSLENADVEFSDSNLLCGDSLKIYISFSRDKNKKKRIIRDIKFDGVGCAISIASASILTEFVKGKSIEEIKKIKNEDVKKMLGIDLGPVRVKCALLALKVLKMAIYKYEAEELEKSKK